MSGGATTLVLFGIEQYRAPDRASEAIRLDPVVAAPGEHRLEVAVRLPDGYVLNDLAPLHVEWSGGVDSGEFSAIAPNSPITLTLSGLTGDSAVVRIDLTVYYCTANAKELCLIDQAAYELPLTVAAGGAAGSGLEHVVVVAG